MRGRLEARYRKVVVTPEWSGAELRELGYSLRTTVKSWDMQRRAILARLNWNALSYLAMLPAAKDFVGMTAELAGDPDKQRVAFKKRFEAYSQLNAA